MKIKLSVVDVLPDCPIRRPLRYFMPGRRIVGWDYGNDTAERPAE